VGGVGFLTPPTASRRVRGLGQRPRLNLTIDMTSKMAGSLGKPLAPEDREYNPELVCRLAPRPIRPCRGVSKASSLYPQGWQASVQGRGTGAHFTSLIVLLEDQ
jgi:hypothetical protein